MDIRQIAQRLNQKAVEEGYDIGELPELRKKFLHKKKLPSTIFTYHTIFEEENYAFHHGGRDEIQFNVGEDGIDGESHTRYALCFSLDPSHSLPDPVNDLNPFRDRFNKCIETHPDYFNEFQMWYFQNGERHGNFPSQIISDNWFQYKTFIAIGQLIPKPLKELNESDLAEILSGFDKLLPIYQYCVLQSPSILAKEKRIARICWNSNGWVMPSGPYGKSGYADSHEAKHGYGHEEWLFDTSKLIDGYHYGFLEPIRKQQAAYTNNMYDVWLFSIDGESKKRYWIGEIENLEVIDKSTADQIKKEYVQQGWLNEMEEQIKASGANSHGFSNWDGVDLFNIRFLPSNIKLNDPYFELQNDHPISEQSRYSFAHFKDEFIVEMAEASDNFSFTPRSKNELTKKIEALAVREYIRPIKTVEVSFLHEAISKNLSAALTEIYGAENVTREHPAGYGANKIDIVVNSPKGLFFYEIKTYNSLKTSIREAIGQLMEYSLWKNQNKAKQMIIITQPHKDIENVKIYFSHLRDAFNLPIYYQSYDYQTNLLSDLY